MTDLTPEAQALNSLASTADEELLRLLARETNFYLEALRLRAGRTILHSQDLRDILYRMLDIAKLSPPEVKKDLSEPSPSAFASDLKPIRALKLGKTEPSP